MADDDYGPVNAPGEDAELDAAFERARDTFKFFWREAYAEQHRIVPGLDLATVKVSFDVSGGDPDATVKTEHMWVAAPSYDGREIRGPLINQPEHTDAYAPGDVVTAAAHDISDWMYVTGDAVYGAFTVHVLRGRMPKRERKKHDSAWGLKFGDADHPLIVPGGDLEAEHPFFANGLKPFALALAEDPSHATATDENGWSLLHHHALAGNAGFIQALLAVGADRELETPDGRTARAIAQAAGWPAAVDALSS